MATQAAHYNLGQPSKERERATAQDDGAYIVRYLAETFPKFCSRIARQPGDCASVLLESLIGVKTLTKKRSFISKLMGESRENLMNKALFK